MSVHSINDTPTRVPDAQHLEHLLDQAQEAVDRSDHMLAVTHLAQGCMVAASKGTRLSELELLRRVKRIIDRGGRVA